MSVRTARLADLQQTATTPIVAPNRAVTRWLFTVCAKALLLFVVVLWLIHQLVYQSVARK